MLKPDVFEMIFFTSVQKGCIDVQVLDVFMICLDFHTVSPTRCRCSTKFRLLFRCYGEADDGLPTEVTPAVGVS